jgi:hypothetical protein
MISNIALVSYSTAPGAYAPNTVATYTKYTSHTVHTYYIDWAGLGPSGAGDQPAYLSSLQQWLLGHATCYLLTCPRPRIEFSWLEGVEVQGGAHLSSHRTVRCLEQPNSVT